jgi:cation:H+ antiporter
VTLALLVIAFVLILIGAELFTNGVEWLGHLLGLGEGAVGSVLAAVGTALPETMIPLVAIVFGAGASSDAVGIGAILGAPFMLATLAMFVTGLAVVWRMRRGSPDAGTGQVAGAGSPADPALAAQAGRTADLMTVDPKVVGHDLRAFGLIYLLAISVAFLPADLSLPRWLMAVVLVIAYGRYVAGHLGDPPADDAELPGPLRFRRHRAPANEAAAVVPGLPIVLLQVGVALAAIIGGAVVFVDAVETLARGIGLDETLLSLVIAPIATELPEKLNSVIWVGRWKDTLALGNITGAMVFQAAIPTSIALIFASSQWSISGESLVAFASAGVALASTALIFLPMVRSGSLHGRRLLIGGVFYLAQLGLVAVNLSGLAGS